MNKLLRQHPALFSPRLWLLCALLAAGFTHTAWASSSMRCSSRIVNEGDLAAELLAACGAPDYRDQWFFEAPGGRFVAETEVWTYDFGSSQLLRLVKLRDGRIIEIETDGYGFPKGVELRCRASEVQEGLSKYRLFRKCGEPLTRRTENAYRPLPARPNVYRDGRDGQYEHRNQYVVPVYREEWVYNFGPNAPMRRVIIEDGWITYVEMLDRGFSPR